MKSTITTNSKNKFSSCETDTYYGEVKAENTIKRTTSSANPRSIERVPAGAVFKAQFVINVWDDDEEKDLLDLFMRGMKLLQNDYLGGNGSRGYGQIEFGELKRTDYSPENDWNGDSKDSIKLT